jgi:hypothetical protein
VCARSFSQGKAPVTAGRTCAHRLQRGRCRRGRRCCRRARVVRAAGGVLPAGAGAAEALRREARLRVDGREGCD